MRFVVTISNKRLLWLSWLSWLVVSEGVDWPDEEEYCPPDDAKDIIIRLLNHNPVDRLGAGGVLEVKEHIFFEGLDWDGLLRQKAEFVPHLSNEEDTSYFDSMFDRLMNMIEYLNTRTQSNNKSKYFSVHYYSSIILIFN